MASPEKSTILSSWQYYYKQLELLLLILVCIYKSCFVYFWKKMWCRKVMIFVYLVLEKSLKNHGKWFSKNSVHPVTTTWTNFTKFLGHLLRDDPIVMVKMSVHPYGPSICPYVQNQTQCSHKPNSGIFKVSETFTMIWLSRSSKVRVKVRRWPQSPFRTIFCNAACILTADFQLHLY